MKKEKITGFIYGFVVASMISVLSVSALAEGITENLSVLYDDIKIIIDGKSVEFTQGLDGTTMEPFITNGTTYLPVRAVGNALGKDVAWDGETNTVYLGLVPGQINYMTDIIEPYKNQYIDIYTNDTAYTFSMGGVEYNNGYVMGNFIDNYMYFNLNGQYETITGDLGVVDWNEERNRFINIYLDGQLYDSIELINGELPYEITIPVSGVLQMQIESPLESGNGNTYIGFGNVVIE